MMLHSIFLYAQSDVVILDLSDDLASVVANLSESDFEKNEESLVFHVSKGVEYRGESGDYRFYEGSYITFFERDDVLVPVLVIGSAESEGNLFAGAYYFESGGLYRVAVAPTYRVSVSRSNPEKVFYYYGARSGKVSGRGLILNWDGVIPADWVSPGKWLRKEESRFMAEKLLTLSKLLEYSEFLKIHRRNPFAPYIAHSLYIYCGILESKNLVRSPLGKSIIKKIKSNAEHVFKK